MEDAVSIARTMGIRESGFDESWLQEQIYVRPSCLGLGDLIAISKERRQSAGGRLDLLLKNLEDDSMATGEARRTVTWTFSSTLSPRQVPGSQRVSSLTSRSCRAGE